MKKITTAMVALLMATIAHAQLTIAAEAGWSKPNYKQKPTTACRLTYRAWKFATIEGAVQTHGQEYFTLVSLTSGVEVTAGKFWFGINGGAGLMLSLPMIDRHIMGTDTIYNRHGYTTPNITLGVANARAGYYINDVWRVYGNVSQNWGQAYGIRHTWFHIGTSIRLTHNNPNKG